MRGFAQKNALWDAINRYATACGGDPSAHVYGNSARQQDVASVEAAVDAIAAAARGEGAEEERRSILHETGSTVVKACAALVRLNAPDDADEAYVPRAAVVDIAMKLKRDVDAILSRAAAGGQGGGE